MTLWEAKNFITRILNYWIESKYRTRANEQKQQSKTG